MIMITIMIWVYNHIMWYMIMILYVLGYMLINHSKINQISKSITSTFLFSLLWEKKKK